MPQSDGNSLWRTLDVKPILMVPTHIEQTCNAFDAQQSGCCAVSDRFDLDTLLALSKQSIDPALFRHWVQQAKWLILREFREDLLSPDSIGFVHLLKGKLI